MKGLKVVLLLIVLCVPVGVLAQQSMQTSQVSVGIVENARPVELRKDNTRKGVVAGTAVGALRDSNHRTRSVVTGALVGGAVGRATSKSASGMEYTIRTAPNNVVTVVSNQTQIQVGDCVSVQQSSNSANVSRIDPNQCAKVNVQQEAQPAASSDINACETAKQELANASTKEALELAKQKMDMLCN